MALAKNQPVHPGPKPPDNTKKLITLVTPVIFDSVPLGKKFGDVEKNAEKEYCLKKTVTVKFFAGNPRNKLIPNFLSVERKLSNGRWRVVLNDASWDTKFIWTRTNVLLGRSLVTVEWYIHPGTQPGIYRIRHFGTYKRLIFGLKSYTGKSREFRVAQC